MSSLSLRFFSLLKPVMQDNFTVKRYKKNMKIFTFLFTFSVLSIDTFILKSALNATNRCIDDKEFALCNSHLYTHVQ